MKTGDLFPDGIRESAHDFVYCVSEALTVLSWFENLPDDEQPPRHIWWSDEMLSEWFRNVKENRKKEAGPVRRSSYDEATDVPMSENELIDRSGSRPVFKQEPD